MRRRYAGGLPGEPHLGHNARVLIHRIDTDALKVLLDERRMTAHQLARETGLSKSFVKYLVNGERNPGKANAELIATVLDVPVSRFVTEEWAPRRRTHPTAA